jgi:hypothetical protein
LVEKTTKTTLKNFKNRQKSQKLKSHFPYRRNTINFVMPSFGSSAAAAKAAVRRVDTASKKKMEKSANAANAAIIYERGDIRCTNAATEVAESVANLRKARRDFMDAVRRAAAVRRVDTARRAGPPPTREELASRMAKFKAQEAYADAVAAAHRAGEPIPPIPKCLQEPTTEDASTVPAVCALQ